MSSRRKHCLRTRRYRSSRTHTRLVALALTSYLLFGPTDPCSLSTFKPRLECSRHLSLPLQLVVHRSHLSPACLSHDAWGCISLLSQFSACSSVRQCSLSILSIRHTGRACLRARRLRSQYTRGSGSCGAPSSLFSCCKPRST